MNILLYGSEQMEYVQDLVILIIVCQSIILCIAAIHYIAQLIQDKQNKKRSI